MVDLNELTFYKINKKQLRDFDVDPLTVQVEGHVLIIKNNEVYHSPRLCRWMKNK